MLYIFLEFIRIVKILVNIMYQQIVTLLIIILFKHCFSLQSRNRERKATTVLKGLGRNSDRTALASYIRLFEPMVIQALKVSE